MATDIRKDNLVRSQDWRYKSRAPYLDQVKHLNDQFLHMGYDYRGQLYRKSTSPELWGNPIQNPMIGRLEAIMTNILENVKVIKKAFSIAHDKDTINIS